MKTEPMIFSMLLHLSMNMWGDKDSRLKLWEDKLEADMDVWRKITDAMPSFGFNSVLIDVGNSLRYESHPELAIEGSLSKDDFKKELDRLRSIGLEPMPKLNFSGGHDAWLKDWSRMLGTEKYRRTAAELIEEVSELFGRPRFFHLGLDEEDALNQRALQFQCVRRGEVLWRDVYSLFDSAEKAGTTPWIWSDFYWHHPEEFMEKMPKSVLQCCWNYGPIASIPSKRHPDLRMESLNDPSVHVEGAKPNMADIGILEFDKAGFTQTLCCSNYTCFESSDRTMEVGRDYLDQSRLAGYFTAPWSGLQKPDEFYHLDAMQRFWSAKKKYYPELCQG